MKKIVFRDKVFNLKNQFEYLFVKTEVFFFRFGFAMKSNRAFYILSDFIIFPTLLVFCGLHFFIK